MSPDLKQVQINARKKKKKERKEFMQKNKKIKKINARYMSLLTQAGSPECSPYQSGPAPPFRDSVSSALLEVM